VIVPIVDLRVKFSQSDVDYNENTVVIVLNLGQRVGIVVDGVSDVLSLTTDQIRPHRSLRSRWSMEYLTDWCAGDRMLILVNIEKLLNSEETGAAGYCRIAYGIKVVNIIILCNI
jgi:purine-binding chemotaxis protein CheW